MSELLLGARRTGRDKTPKDPEPGKAFPWRRDLPEHAWPG